MSNREIDALVATHAFCEPIPTAEPDFDLPPIGMWFAVDPYGEPQRWECPAFSTDPAASKRLRDRMRELGWNWQTTSEGGLYLTIFWKGEDAEVSGLADADAEELADALAALKALGVQVD